MTSPLRHISHTIILVPATPELIVDDRDEAQARRGAATIKSAATAPAPSPAAAAAAKHHLSPRRRSDGGTSATQLCTSR